MQFTKRIFSFFSRPNTYIVLFILLASILLAVFYEPPSTRGHKSVVGNTLFEAKVLEILSEEPLLGREEGAIKQSLRIGVLSQNSEEAVIVNDYVPLEVGSRLYVQKGSFEDRYTISNINRSRGFLVPLILFIVLVLLVGGRYGWNSLVGLFFSLVVVVKFLVPAIISGSNPVFAGLVSAATILLVALYASHGLNAKSFTAFTSIFLSLITAGVLALYSVSALQLTGFTHESIYLNFVSNGGIDFSGILIAGILIAAIGVLDDAAVTQASTVFALASAQPMLRGMKLFRKAMAVGRDHIAAITNTLVLAYVGAGLPLLLLLSLNRYPLALAVSGEALATEIIRTLVASFGLILAVPLTTAIAVFVVGRWKNALQYAHDNEKVGTPHTH